MQCSETQPLTEKWYKQEKRWKEKNRVERGWHWYSYPKEAGEKKILALLFFKRGLCSCVLGRESKYAGM